MLTNSHLALLIDRQADNYGVRTALSYPDSPPDKARMWKNVSWKQFADTVAATSNALLALDVGVQENIAVFSQNMPECLYLDFGAYGCRAVTVPLYATSSEAQVAYVMNEAGVRYIFVGEQPQYDVAFRVFSLCPKLEKLVVFDPSVRRHTQDAVSISFDEFLLLGRDGAYGQELARRKAEARWEDLANILYTSGTTGESKGVMLTYGMYHEALRVNDGPLNLSERDVALCFLPFTHVFERAWSYLCLAEGCQLAINRNPNDILLSLTEVHPTCMCAVPRFWEKVFAGVEEKIEKSSFVAKQLMRKALQVGRRYNIDYRSKGITPPAALTLQYRFFEETAIKLLKKTLGLERANFFPTAGAAIPAAVEEFVHACGIRMVAGYGLTESTATVSCDVPGKPYSIGSVGQIVDGLEVKIGDNSEVLLRGKTITAGYYRKEAATKAAIDDEGWFHTGDAGYLRNGELFLTERIKDLFKTSNGKYIAPQMIEAKLVVDRYIDQVVVVADRRKFVAALVIPEYELLKKYAAEQKIDAANRAECCRNEQIRRFVYERIATLQQEFASYEQIKRIVLLPEPFSIASGELTNTLKVRRGVVYERYAAEIEAMYREA